MFAPGIGGCVGARVEEMCEARHLLERKRLGLICDLDQTLVHAVTTLPTEDGVVTLKAEKTTFYVRVRPGTHAFLAFAAQHYELHINTHGSRTYAEAVARHLDPTGELFGGRIVSRDDVGGCFLKRTSSSYKGIVGERLVLALDDRHDVWLPSVPLLQVRPYFYYNRGLSAETDRDAQLLHAQRALRAIHKAYFAKLKRAPKTIPHLLDTVNAIRARILKGCTVAVKVINPSEGADLVRRARLLGASVEGDPTHVVRHVSCAASKDVEEVRVVQPSWINASFTNWVRECEAKHTAVPLPTKRRRVGV